MSTMHAYAEPRFAPLPPVSNLGAAMPWERIIGQLRRKPNEWAAVGTKTVASMGSRATKLRARGVETSIRSNGDGTWTIWACYVGTGAPMPEPLIVPADVMADWFGVAS